MDAHIQTSRTVREARRQSALARAIVEQHTGPMKKVVSLSRRYPGPAIIIAIGLGVLAALMFSRD